MSNALNFTSFEKFKSEVAQRTRRALMEQNALGGGLGGAPPLDSEGVSRRPSYLEGTQPYRWHDSPSSDLFHSTASEISRQEDTDDFRHRYKAEGGSSHHIPVYEKVPERLKHVPKSQSMQESRKLAPTPLSQRMLQMMPGKARFVTLYANDGQYNKPGTRILLPETIDLLLDVAVQKLNLPAAARLIFRLDDGSTVQHVDEIIDEDYLVISCKEPLKPQVDNEARLRPKTAPPVKTNNGTPPVVRSPPPPPPPLELLASTSCAPHGTSPDTTASAALSPPCWVPTATEKRNKRVSSSLAGLAVHAGSPASVTQLKHLLQVT